MGGLGVCRGSCVAPLKSAAGTAPPAGQLPVGLPESTAVGSKISEAWTCQRDVPRGQFYGGQVEVQPALTFI